MTKRWRRGWAGGILVNAIAPTTILTPKERNV
jgi:NAD(P)-dependent dehydrogenase (short-subunit alcohol dehydrogenase family)